MKYSDAGVDISKESGFVKTLLSQIDSSRRGKLSMHFTGLIEFGDYYIAMNTDGVGTKVLVANEMQKWDTVGIDCIAMNVNDTVCVGAKPLAFVDYLAIEKYDLEMARQIGIGLNRGAQIADVVLLGGETATLPEIVNGFDLSGTSIGIVEKDRVITGDRIASGDIIIGIPSSGIHSNGLTLARKVLDLHDEINGVKIGHILLEPTRIYVREIMRVLKKCGDGIHGLVHITGGGLKNMLRLKNMRYVITSPLPPQKIFDVIMERSGEDYQEMYQTFNMGMGFAIIADESCEGAILREIKDARVVGYVENGKGVEIEELGVRYEDY